MKYLGTMLIYVCWVATSFEIGVAQVTLGTPQRITLSTSGTSPNAESSNPILSTNGGFLVFQSSSSNLVNNDLNSSTDIFLRNISFNTTTRVSVSSSGTESDDSSQNPAISPLFSSGFFAVAFASNATNLGTINDTFGSRDIFFHIPSLGLTESATPGSTFNGIDNDAFSPSITVIPDQTQILIAYDTNASNIVTVDQNNLKDIYLARIQIPSSAASFVPSQNISTTKVSAGIGATGTDGDSRDPKVNGGGNFIVYSSTATNISGIGSGGFEQIYLYNISSLTNSLISKTTGGVAGNGNSSKPIISYNGRYVTFITSSTNLVTTNTSGLDVVVRLDTTTGTFQHVNMRSDGTVGSGDATECSMSADGRFIAFTDSSSNLVSNDTNGQADVFVKDMDTGSLTRVSVGSSGAEANDQSASGSMARSGYNTLTATIAFSSTANNIVTGSTTIGEVFSNTAQISRLAFTKNTKIEVPPDISVSGRKATFTLQPFSGFSSSSAVKVNGVLTSEARKKPKKTIRYETTVQSSTGDTRRKNSKRNNATFGKLPPGTYTGSYRVRLMKGKKPGRRFGVSPNTTFTVQ